MNKLFFLFLLVFLINSCKSPISKRKHVVEKEYEIFQAENSKAVLVLFPCFPCDNENTKTEFPIIEQANKEGISVLLMNYNYKLFLKEDELLELAHQLSAIFETYNLNNKKVFIGGFSGGGNVSLLLSNYLLANPNLVQPKGVFIVDAPIDLLGLYEVAEKNKKSNFSEESVEESNYIIEKFNADFGNQKDSISLYEKFSPFTSKTSNIGNLKNLKNIKIRFYTEPDVNWWKTNKNNDEEDLNAFFIKNLYLTLKTNSFKNVALIETVNKGFRANGERHPHSWSIVDKDELLKWIKE